MEKIFGSRYVLVPFLNLLLLKSYEFLPLTSIPKFSKECWVITQF